MASNFNQYADPESILKADIPKKVLKESGKKTWLFLAFGTPDLATKVKYYSMELKREPDHHKALYYRSRELSKLGLNDLAIKDAQKLIEIKPDRK